MNLRPLLLVAIGALAFLAPSAAATERQFDVNGIIRGRLDDGQLVIEHEEIAGYMPPMTMAFAVATPSEAAALKDGDRVRFRYRVNETSSVADAFQVVGSAPARRADASSAKRARLRAGDSVPPMSLLDEQGRTLTESVWRDRFTIVTFIFTRCPVPEYCPAMAARFGELQRAILAAPELKAKSRLLSITLDPEFDRPEILKSYAHGVGANPDVWRFATGETAEINALTKSFAVYTERNGVTLDHTLTTALVGPDGRIIELWRGNGWKTAEVITALTAAAKSQTESLLAKASCGCGQPKTGAP